MKHNNIIFAGIFSLCSLGAAVAQAADGSHWDYNKQGDDWSGVCAKGKSQSPVNIATDKIAAGKHQVLGSFRSNKVDTIHKGHTIQYNPQGRSLQLVDNASGEQETFKLLQFHIHNGSEHTVDGKRHDLEAHFVHANNAFVNGESGGRLAVVGVFLNADDEDQNPHWDRLLTNLPKHDGKQGETTTKSATADYEKLLAENGDFYTYEGSLTTPGCNEIVNWMVLKQPVSISSAAVESFAASQKAQLTYRSVQPLNGRVLRTGQLSSKL